MGFSRHSRVASRIVEGRALVVSIDANRLYALNELGSTIWELLARPRTLDEVVAEICAHFSVDGPTARADCERFIRDMLEKGLLAESS